MDGASSRVVGYYTTLTYRLELDEVAVAFGTGGRRYPMPAVLLARLAVDRGAQGSGLGARLLRDALHRVGEAAASVGFEVVVHAIDDDAATFYRYFGFTPFLDHPRHLLLTTKDLLATLRAATSDLYVPQTYNRPWRSPPCPATLNALTYRMSLCAELSGSTFASHRRL